MVMKLRTNAPDWFNEDHPEKQAKCVSFPGTREYDPWFGTSSIYGEESELSEMEEAKRICHGTDDKRPCPLLLDCLEFAVVNNEKYGVWGGTDPDERRDLRRKRRKAWQSRQDGDQSPSSQGDWRIMQQQEKQPSS